ncbi:MAG: sensory rhodopsin transducer, partial [Gammaproteobacteria bacterium]|nr:sensory rhodopsin transducer [Gammaproteobacteria bacterium]
MSKTMRPGPIRLWPYLGLASACLCALLLALVMVLYRTPYDAKWWLVMAALLAFAFLAPLVLLALWRGLTITPPPWRSRVFLPAIIVICLAVGWSQGTFLHAFAFGRSDSLAMSPPGALNTHYLIDYEIVRDEREGHATDAYLLLLNPGGKTANLDVTVFYEDQEPQQFSLAVKGERVAGSNYSAWPVEPNRRFALRVESDQPVIAQATMGWTNTLGDHSIGAPTSSPMGPREIAKSYMSSRSLGTSCFVPDGFVIHKPGEIWVKESESVLLLNPGDVDAEVELLIYGKLHMMKSHRVRVPARRLASVSMDSLVTPNEHYGVRIKSTVPVAGQWLRSLKWYDSPELMSYWSV